MNAAALARPDPPAPAVRQDDTPMQPVLLDRLRDSHLQHRHVYDVKRLEELALDILEHGLREAPTARYLPSIIGSFELSVGHRRVRACVIAELRRRGVTFDEERRMERQEPEAIAELRRTIAATTTILVRVREMTDQQVLEEQEAENFNKVTPHPIEEAALYERYLRIVQADPGFATARAEVQIREVAKRLHKEPEHVTRTLKLLGLSPVVQDRFFADEDLDIRLAYELARHTAHATQEKAAPVVLGDPNALDERARMPLSLTEARRVLKQRFMLLLQDGVTPFDMANTALVDGRPACADCPDRSGNALLLFPDLEDPNVCTSPACWEDKREAQWEQDAAQAKRDGDKVLSRAESRQVFYPNPHEIRLQPGSPYAALDAERWEGDRKTTLRALLGDSLPPIVLARHEGQRVDLVHAKDAEKLLEARTKAAERAALDAKKKPAPALPAPVGRKLTAAEIRQAEEAEQAKKKRASDQEKARLRTLTNAAILAQVVKRWPAALPRAAWVLLAKTLLAVSWEATLAAVLKRRGLVEEPKPGAYAFDKAQLLGRHVDKLKGAKEIQAFVAEILLTRSLDFPEDRLGAIGKALGVDRKKVEAEIAAQEKKAKPSPARTTTATAPAMAARKAAAPAPKAGKPAKRTATATTATAKKGAPPPPPALSPEERARLARVVLGILVEKDELTELEIAKAMELEPLVVIALLNQLRVEGLAAFGGPYEMWSATPRGHRVHDAAPIENDDHPGLAPRPPKDEWILNEVKKHLGTRRWNLAALVDRVVELGAKGAPDLKITAGDVHLAMEPGFRSKLFLRKPKGMVATTEPLRSAPSGKVKADEDGYKPAERTFHSMRVLRELVKENGPLTLEQIEARVADVDIPPLVQHLCDHKLAWWKKEHTRVTYGATDLGRHELAALDGPAKPPPASNGKTHRFVWTGRGGAHVVKPRVRGQAIETYCGLSVDEKMRDAPDGTKLCTTCDAIEQGQTPPPPKAKTPPNPPPLTPENLLRSLRDAGPATMTDLGIRFGLPPMAISPPMLALQSNVYVTFDKKHALGRVWTITATGLGHLAQGEPQAAEPAS